MAPALRTIFRCCFVFLCCLPLALALPEDVAPYPLNLTISGSKAPSLPLAVRNPFLSAWLPGPQGNHLPSARAEFWNGARLGWVILARVDGKTFTLFGAPSAITNLAKATQKSIRYSATHTIVELDAGAASIVVDFFSPVSPNNLVRQSLPFSYVTVTVGGSSNAQILSAIDDSWYGQRPDSVFSNPYTGTTSRNHLVSRYQNTGATSMISLTDPNADDYNVIKINDMAAWGSVILATSKAGNSSVSYQSGPAKTLFSEFVRSGSLHEIIPTYHTAGDYIAFAQKLANMSPNSTSSVTFAVGQYRDNVIQYRGRDRVGFFKSVYHSALDAVDGFLEDYESAFTESKALDKAVHHETRAISHNYTDLTTAAVRQSYGAMEITLPAHNTNDTSNPYVFLKEISTNGDVNTVDVIYPTSTILGVMSPHWIKYLLEPIASFCESSEWTVDYVVHDLGTYPQATGRSPSSSERMFLQNTGDFLIMVYQHQLLTNDTTWAQSHAKLFQKFADYLNANGLHPIKQVDTVDSINATAHQTNLAITAAIGLNAYGALTGKHAYKQAAHSFSNTIYTHGLGTDLNSNGRISKGTPKHFTYSYGDSTSWGTVFNLFPDRHLNLNTFAPSAASMQCAWYMSQATSVGIPYASLQDDIANGMWDMLIAATCPKNADTIIGFEHAFFTNGKNHVPFADRFIVKATSTDQLGMYVQAHARPTLGTTFALLLKKGVSFKRYLSTGGEVSQRGRASSVNISTVVNDKSRLSAIVTGMGV